MSKQLAIMVAVIGLLVPATRAGADGTNSLIMNQANAVSGGKYLQAGKQDAYFATLGPANNGRLEGNGQNWMSLLTTETDPGKNTLDLQGYEIDWAYNKGDGTSSGSGVLKFSNDAVWAAVPLGTLVNINEYQAAWYLINTPATLPGGSPNPDFDTFDGTGMQRDGGINGLGVQTGTPYTGNPAVEQYVDMSSKTGWNPNAAANWNINVWAGQGPAGNVGSNYNFQYFTVSGSVTKNGVTSTVGTDAGGLFVVNNDNWQFIIKDSHGNVVQGPIGEAVPGGWGGGGVNSSELIKIENNQLAIGASPPATLSQYQNITPASYVDGSSSDFRGPSLWTSGTFTEDLNPLRTWFNSIKPGDVNLDGIVNGQDIATVASNWLDTGTSVGLQQGDTNGDGIVNGQDIAAIASNWLQTGGAPGGGGSGAAVPEPASCVLCAIGMFVCLAWHSLRRRNRR